MILVLCEYFMCYLLEEEEEEKEDSFVVLQEFINYRNVLLVFVKGKKSIVLVYLFG